MTVPTVPAVPAVPIRSQAANETAFRTAVEAFLASLNPLSTGFNAAVAAFNTDFAAIAGYLAQADASADAAQDIYELFAAANLPALNGTSATTSAIALGSKTITASTGKIWWPGLNVYARDAANPANFIVGPVTAYNATTGSLTVDVKNTGGSGSPASWLIYPAGPRDITAQRLQYEAIGTLPTTSGTAWTINPLPIVYADLHFEIAGVSTTNSTSGFQVEVYDGTSWLTPVNLTGNTLGAAVLTGSVRLSGYNLKITSLVAGGFGSGTNAAVTTANGVKGVRFSYVGGLAGTAGAIRAWGR